MVSCTRWLKVGYVLALTTAVVLLLSKPAPVQAQRTIAYPFIPGALTNALQMSLVAGFSGPFNSYNAANQMLMQAGIPVGLAAGGGQGIAGGGAMGLGGFGGGAMGLGGGGMMGMGGGMMGMGGGQMGMGGMGGMMGMGGMQGGMGGIGGMGGFAGKGMGGFNGKKAL
jgi:hypothetical protein